MIGVVTRHIPIVLLPREAAANPKLEFREARVGVEGRQQSQQFREDGFARFFQVIGVRAFRVGVAALVLDSDGYRFVNDGVVC